jgi:hypothetical protein
LTTYESRLITSPQEEESMKEPGLKSMIDQMNKGLQAKRDHLKRLEVMAEIANKLYNAMEKSEELDKPAKPKKIWAKKGRVKLGSITKIAIGLAEDGKKEICSADVIKYAKKHKLMINPKSVYPTLFASKRFGRLDGGYFILKAAE